MKRKNSLPPNFKEDSPQVRDNLIKAQTLSQALPFIQEFHKKLIIVKLGGSTLEVDTDERLNLFIQDLVLLKTVGIHPILIHGGGAKISQLLKRLGKTPEFLHGLRVTDGETMEITQMVLAGLINKNLVSRIALKGGKAVGLSGQDGNIALGRRLDKGQVDYGQVGEIVKIDTGLILRLTETGYIPVIAPIATDPEGLSLNINADTFAAEVALALRAEKLIFISDVPGVLADVDKPDTLYSSLRLRDIETLIEDKVVASGMIPKLQAAAKALTHGVNKVHFITEKVNHSLLVELFTAEGIGTLITKE